MKDSEDDKQEPRIEIGPVCPPLKSWVFSFDGSFEPYELENMKDGEDEHATQSP